MAGLTVPESHSSKITVVSRDSKSEVKKSDMLGKETNEAEYLDILLSKSAKVLNINWESEETYASTTSNGKTSSSSFDN